MPSGVYDRKKVNRKPKVSSGPNAVEKAILGEELPETVKEANKVEAGIDEIQTRLNEKKQEGASETEPKISLKERRRIERETNEQKSLESIKGGLSLLTDFVLDFACSRMPNPIPATDMEKRLFNQSAESIVDKYIPMLLPYSVEITFAVVTIGILAPRYVSTENKRKSSGETVDDTSKSQGDSDIRQNGLGEKQVSENTPETISQSSNP